MLRRLSLAFALFAAPVSAEKAHHGDIMVSGAYTYETPKSAPSGAGYLTVMNMGDTDDVLLAVRSDPMQVMMHETIEENGVARMVHKMSVPVAAGDTVSFEPGGLHIMFMGLNGDPFEEGEAVPATLVFEKAGEVVVDFTVINRRAEPPMDHGAGHDMDHGAGH